MRISDWSSDVCSSDLGRQAAPLDEEGPVRQGVRRIDEEKVVVAPICQPCQGNASADEGAKQTPKPRVRSPAPLRRVIDRSCYRDLQRLKRWTTAARIGALTRTAPRASQGPAPCAADWTS